MKYIDKVIKVNADDENYISGVRLELDNLELHLLFNALEFVIDAEDNQLYKEHKKLFDKLIKFHQVMHNGYLKNVEIE